jgi:hypothetical protein
MSAKIVKKRECVAMFLKYVSYLVSTMLLAACAVTQTPVPVAETPVSQRSPAAQINSSIERQNSASLNGRSLPSEATPANASRLAPKVITLEALNLADIPAIAQSIRKNPASRKSYVGQTLEGRAKFVRTAKGNANVVVADVRVQGLGDVSLWCRNVVNAAQSMPAGRMVHFSGQLSGNVYSSEDFSHDVTLKDCRFLEKR